MHSCWSATPQDMLATWSDPFVEAFRDNGDAGLVELSVVESQVWLPATPSASAIAIIMTAGRCSAYGLPPGLQLRACEWQQPRQGSDVVS